LISFGKNDDNFLQIARYQKNSHLFSHFGGEEMVECLLEQSLIAMLRL
jgi:hypothetical protein